MPPAKSPKGRSILEVMLVFTLILLIQWVWRTTWLSQLQARLLRWNYFSHVVFIAVPILILLGARRSFACYGLSLGNWRYGLTWGGVFVGALAAPPLVGLAFGWAKAELPTYLLSTLIFQIIFSGFGEEILFRGYFQSRMNEEFGRPFEWGGLRFGLGSILTSLMFGLAHVLNPFSPFQGSFALDWWSGLNTGLVGLFLGFVREKTGSILMAGMIHGFVGVMYTFVHGETSTLILHGVGWGIAWFLLFAAFSGSRA
jgi:membrane protease YdiL (CAAX protease family)